MGRISETLDQVLSDGQQPVAKAFVQAFAKHGMTGKGLEVRVAYQQAGEAWQKLWEATLPPEQSRPEAVPNVIEAIRNATLQALGPAASAKLRFRVYVRGKSSEAEVNITREVRPDYADGDYGGGSGDIAMAHAMVAQQHATIVQLAAQNTALATAALHLAGEQAMAQANLAVMRTAGSAAADMGGIWQILGLMGVGIAWPILRETMPEIAQMGPGMAKLFRANLKSALTGNDKAEAATSEWQFPSESDLPPRLEDIPVPTLVDEHGEVLREGRPPATTPARLIAPTVDLDLDALSDAIKRDPELLKAFLKRAENDAELKKAACEAIPALNLLL